MSKTIITIAGAVIGSLIPGVGPQWGATAGAIIGGWLYPPESDAAPMRVGGLRFSAPQKGGVLPVVYGRIRMPGTIIWYGDFQTHAEDAGGSGGGGKGSGQDTYTVGLGIALCEGRASSLLSMWAGGDIVDLSDITYDWEEGEEDQAANSYITSHLASGQVAAAYPGVAYMVLRSFSLGYSTAIPAFTFEIHRTTADVVADNPALTTLGLDGYVEDVNGDMNPVLCLADFMTNPRYGLGFAASDLHADSWQEEAGYADYMDLACSPVLDSAQPGSSHIEHLLSYFDGMMNFSQGRFKLHSRRSPSREDLPYHPIQPWEWLEGMIPKYARGNDRQAPNAVSIEYRDRDDAYNSAVAPIRDDWDVGRRGLYRQQISLPGVTTSAMAVRVISKLLWARITGPKSAEWGMGPAGMWYEPADLVSFDEVGETAYSLEGSLFRIMTIRENPDGTFTFAAVEER